jgi:hypothetical protein
MIVPGYPEGVDAQLLLKDLRFIKIPKEVREKVMELISVYRSRLFTTSEDAWIRSECRKRKKKIIECHKMQDDARITDAKRRIGSKKFAELQRDAKKQTQVRLVAKLEQAQAIIRETEEEQKDLGI